jgi:hypothetical protein
MSSAGASVPWRARSHRSHTVRSRPGGKCARIAQRDVCGTDQHLLVHARKDHPSPTAESPLRVWCDDQEMRSPREGTAWPSVVALLHPSPFGCSGATFGPRRPVRPLQPHAGVCVLRIRRCDPQEMRSPKKQVRRGVWDGEENPSCHAGLQFRRAPVPRNSWVQRRRLANARPARPRPKSAE